MAFMHGEPQSGLPPCSRTLFELSNFSNLIGKTVWLLLPVPSSTPKPYSAVFSGDIYSRRLSSVWGGCSVQCHLEQPASEPAPRVLAPATAQCWGCGPGESTMQVPIDTQDVLI